MHALLPMKGNSERVPEKNFRLLNGKPLFFYVADTLQLTGMFEKLVIDTDSDTIIRLAKKRYGDWVEIIYRPVELQGDHVSMNAVIAHDIKKVGKDNDFLQAHSTSPFLKAETVKAAAKKYFEERDCGAADSVFSVNVLKTRLYDKYIDPINHDPELLERTQDLDVVYEENSNFYFFSGESFFKNNHRIGEFPQFFEMNRNSIESLDIDEQSDWEYAEALLRAGVA